MENSGIEYVGIANIIEKRNYVIDGVEKTCYEFVDAAYGFMHEFSYISDIGKKFVCLSGKYAGRDNIDSNYVNSDVMSIDFKTLLSLAKENNKVLDLDKFMNEYRKKIGYYYYYKETNKFGIITDEKILKVIKNSNKVFDDKILDKNTDISKMYQEIKKTIIAQDEQIMQILTSLFKNQKVINSKLSDDMISKLKENIIIYGSTGTGKTEILKRISKIYNIPIVIEDATSLSETGYVGRKITDMLENLYLASNKDINLAQKGILVIDEFDKLAEKENSKDHVSRIGVQRSLLKLLDGTTFYIDGKKFDTSKLSIVALGAFTGIVENDNYNNIKQSEFVKYGIMRELMGRFSKLIPMKTLTKEDIKRILIESDFSPINTYNELFKTMNIDFSYDDSFIDYIASKAVELNSGARSLKTIFDDEISSALFRVFAGDYSKITLTKPQINGKIYTLTKK